MIEREMRAAKWKRAVKLALIFAASAAMCVAAVCVVRAQEGWVAQKRRVGQAGKDLNAVYFVDSKRGWVAGDGGVVLHTEDGGETWTPQSSGTRASINDIYFRDKDDGYLLAGDQIFVTEDGGAAWHMSARFPASGFDGAEPELYSVRFTSKKRGWIVGSVSKRESVVDSLVIRTTDGGVSWQRQLVPTHGELIHLDFDGDKRGWIVGGAGVILHTRDGGETWQQQISQTRADLYHVDFDGHDHGWAVGESGTVLRTIDGGETWRALSAPVVRSMLLSVKFVNEDEGWIVGRGGAILRTGDGGQTWLQQDSHTKQNLYALFIDKKTGWAVGGDGLILRYAR